MTSVTTGTGGRALRSLVVTTCRVSLFSDTVVVAAGFTSRVCARHCRRSQRVAGEIPSLRTSLVLVCLLGHLVLNIAWQVTAHGCNHCYRYCPGCLPRPVVVTSWVPLGDDTPAQGGLCVLEGSHNILDLEPRVSYLQVCVRRVCARLQSARPNTTDALASSDVHDTCVCTCWV